MTDKMPEQFRGVCRQFVLEYWRDLTRNIEQDFLVALPGTLAEQSHRIIQNPEATILYQDTLTFIAQAAAGEVERTDEAAGLMHEYLLDLHTQVLGVPGLNHIPAEVIQWFHENHPIGQMAALALLWMQGDELMTQAEAAGAFGIAPSTLNSWVRRGNINVYIDPKAPKHQGRRLVSRKEIEAHAGN